jgi:hypothetical protein
VQTRTKVVNEGVGDTLEYKVARDLFTRKLEFSHYLEEINDELKKLRYLSAGTVEVAITDVREEMQLHERERRRDQDRNPRSNRSEHADSGQRNALCIVAKQDS